MKKQRENGAQFVFRSWLVDCWQKIRAWLKYNWYYVVVVGFGILITASIWAEIGNYMYGFDGHFHLLRMQSSLHAMQDGQLVPQIDPTALNGFGYAYNIFYGPLVTYGSAILRLVAGSWQVATNLTLILIVIGAGVLACYATVKMSKKPTLAALVGILYMLNPYFLSNLYVRMTVGEIMAMAVAPLLVLGLYQLVNHELGATRNIVIAGTMMLLNHSLSTVLFGLMAVGYLALNYKSLKSAQIWKQIVVAGVVILGLSAFFILPMMEAKARGNYGIFDAGYSEVYFWANADWLNLDRRPFADLVFDRYDNWSIMHVAIGLLGVLGLGGFWIVRKRIEDKKERKMLTTLYVLVVIFFLLSSRLVDWHFMPSVLYSMQFAWRFMEVATVLLMFVEGYVLYELIKDWSHTKQQLMVIVMGLVALYPVQDLVSLHEWIHFDADEDIVVTDHFNRGLGAQNEYLPIELLCENIKDTKANCNTDLAFEILNERGRGLEVVSGGLEIEAGEKRGTKVDFTITNDASGAVELPLIWYPGYQARIGKEKLEVRASEKLGLVEVVIPEGWAGEKVQVKYGMSMATKVGVVISGLTLVGCIGYTGYGMWQKRKKNKIGQKDDTAA